jgi:hypothetical protein
LGGCANSGYFSNRSGSQNSGKEISYLKVEAGESISEFILFLFELPALLIKYTCFGACLIKQCFVESKTAWQRCIFAQNTLGSADFCIKSNSNALAEFAKHRIGASN